MICDSFIASSSADCVLGVVRLISSATMMLAKIGPGLEFEFLGYGVVDADADHVARQHVGGELDALERAVKGARDGVRERGLADAGNVFDEQVAAGEKRHQRHLDDFFLALYYAGDGALKIGDAAAGVSGRRLQFARPSVTKSEFDSGAISSVVRALPSHGRGPRFKSLIAHHPQSQFCHCWMRLSKFA